jgi:uncharacterized protein (TIGR02145 family)
LPSDYEWNQLEKEIATNPSPYADQTTPLAWDTSYESAIGYRPVSGTAENYWGRQMKSQTTVNNNPTNGKSYPSANGGFDALLVGFIAMNGNIAYYGGETDFSSSSSNASGYAWCRILNNSNSGMDRRTTYKNYLLSVRCKKND